MSLLGGIILVGLQAHKIKSWYISGEWNEAKRRGTMQSDVNFFAGSKIELSKMGLN